MNGSPIQAADPFAALRNFGITAAQAAQTYASLSSAFGAPRKSFFKVTPLGDAFLVSFDHPDIQRLRDMRKWFRNAGGKARHSDDYGYAFKCDRNTALLAKLTWGGDE